MIKLSGEEIGQFLSLAVREGWMMIRDVLAGKTARQETRHYDPLGNAP
jgi:hypothetical protein